MREAFKQFLIITFLIALLVLAISALAVAEGKSPGLNIEWRVAIASWYGEPFFGNRTANGEFFTPYVISVAHRTLPFNTIVEICYPVRDKCIYTRVNDRGPWFKDRSGRYTREFDLSAMSAKLLGFGGVDEVYWRVIFWPVEK